MREKKPGATHWLKVDSIVQAALRNEMLSDERTWQTVVLILKGGGGDFWVIGLMRVL